VAQPTTKTTTDRVINVRFIQCKKQQTVLVCSISLTAQSLTQNDEQQDNAKLCQDVAKHFDPLSIPCHLFG